jgi:hypothetical protein
MEALLDQLRPRSVRSWLVVGGVGALGALAGLAAWPDDPPTPVIAAALNPYAVCLDQRVDGIYLEDATREGRIQLGMVPFLDIDAPVRADDRAFDDDHIWRPRGRRVEIRDSSNDEVVFDDHLTGSEPCAFFSHRSETLTVRVTAVGEASAAGGTVLFRAGDDWRAPPREPILDAEGRDEHRLVPNETEHLRIAHSRVGQTLALAAFAVDVRLQELRFGTKKEPFRIFFQTRPLPDCDEHPCVRFGEVEPGVSSIHLSPEDLSRKYLMGAAFARATMEQRLGRPWRYADSTPSSGSLMTPVTPWTAARRGWSAFMSAAMWNDRGPGSEAYFSLWPPACVPGADDSSPQCALPAGLPRQPGYPDTWHANYLPLHTEDSLCTYWEENTGHCPRDATHRVACSPSGAPVSVPVDWMRHFWALSTGGSNDSTDPPPSLEILTNIVESSARESQTEFDAPRLMRMKVPDDFGAAWTASATQRRIDSGCE